MTQEAFDGAKAGLDMMTQTWTEAGSAFTSGNVAEAVAKAQTVKAKAAEVMTALAWKCCCAQVEFAGSLGTGGGFAGPGLSSRSRRFHITGTPRGLHAPSPTCGLYWPRG